MNYACKNKNNPINYLPKVVFQDLRIVQAEGGNRLQAVGWCIAKVTFALISFMRFG